MRIGHGGGDGGDFARNVLNAKNIATRISDYEREICHSTNVRVKNIPVAYWKVIFFLSSPIIRYWFRIMFRRVVTELYCNIPI